MREEASGNAIQGEWLAAGRNSATLGELWAVAHPSSQTVQRPSRVAIRAGARTAEIYLQGLAASAGHHFGIITGRIRAENWSRYLSGRSLSPHLTFTSPYPQ
jgi:hypothetical protein